MGDLTFLHDVGGLLRGPLEPSVDLQVVVANDDGGSIFATLEPGEPGREEAFERVFGTPHGTDVAALCAGYGVRHTRVGDVDGLCPRSPRRVRGCRSSRCASTAPTGARWGSGSRLRSRRRSPGSTEPRT